MRSVLIRGVVDVSGRLSTYIPNLRPFRVSCKYLVVAKTARSSESWVEYRCSASDSFLEKKPNEAHVPSARCLAKAIPIPKFEVAMRKAIIQMDDGKLN